MRTPLLLAAVLAAGCGRTEPTAAEPEPAEPVARASVPTTPAGKYVSVHPSAVALETVWRAYQADPAAAEIQYGRGVVVFVVKSVEKSPLKRWDVFSDDGGGNHVIEMPLAAGPRLVGASGKDYQVPYVVKSSSAHGLVLKFDTQYKP